MANSQPRKQGDFFQVDYFDNIGGVNNTDSPFKVQDSQTILAHDYDYNSTGGFQKRFGHTLLNSSPDTQLRQLGCFVHADLSNNKTLLRAAGTRFQTVNKTTGATTNLIDDTVSAGSTPYSSNQPVVFSQFNTPTTVVSWGAGGGQGSGVINGYNGTTYTSNGVPAATGAITSTNNNAGTQNLPTGAYFYAVTLVKASTGSESNAGLDLSVSVTTGASGVVKISLTSLTSLDTTKYSSIKLYRSVITGVTGFTTGDLVGTVASTATFISDAGTVPSLNLTVIPRAGNISLDKSVLPAGTYNVITTYKRHLVTAQNSTVYFSDVNLPESWPTTNTITIPSGGPITAIGVINFNTPTSSSINEVLVVFKEREAWVINGSFFTTVTSSTGQVLTQADITLLYMDNTGCIAQPLLVNANGLLFWIDYRGIYFWDGSSKPVYCSRTIEFDFNQINNGDMDLANLQYGNGFFLRRKNQVIWHVSSKSLGVNKLALKFDIRLTMMQAFVPIALAGRIMEGVFMKDNLTYPIYSSCSSIISSQEVAYAGGAEGNIWTLYDNLNSDGGSAINFSYRTRPLDMGVISTTKRFHKVIAWCQESTQNNLTLNFWTNYRNISIYQASQVEQVTSQVSTGIWDQSTWDSSYWDTTYSTYTPVVFNLNSADIGTEGEALTLEFQQQDLNAPLIIAGFSVIFSLAGVRD